DVQAIREDAVCGNRAAHEQVAVDERGDGQPARARAVARLRECAVRLVERHLVEVDRPCVALRSDREVRLTVAPGGARDDTADARGTARAGRAGCAVAASGAGLALSD